MIFYDQEWNKFYTKYSTNFLFPLWLIQPKTFTGETIMPWHHHIDVVCSQLYKRYIVFIVVFIGVRRGTKQRQRHRDTAIIQAAVKR